MVRIDRQVYLLCERERVPFAKDSGKLLRFVGQHDVHFRAGGFNHLDLHRQTACSRLYMLGPDAERNRLANR